MKTLLLGHNLRPLLWAASPHRLLGLQRVVLWGEDLGKDPGTFFLTGGRGQGRWQYLAGVREDKNQESVQDCLQECWGRRKGGLSAVGYSILFCSHQPLHSRAC